MDLTSNVVSLTGCTGYEADLLSESVDRIVSSLPLSMELRSAKILLKPNLISAKQGPLACTEGRFILAVAKWFLEKGATVSVGDSPAFGNSYSVLRALSLDKELERMGVLIRNFDKVFSVSLSSGTQTGLARDALDCDLLVNLPRIKAHGQLLVTMGVKNFFGCVVGMRKPLWHMLHGGVCGRFSSLLVELLAVLPPSLTLVDGITAMNRTGPIKGEVVTLGLMAGSLNPVAVDRALLYVLGIDPGKSPLMQACVKAELCGCLLDELVFPLESPEQLKVTSFRVPEALTPIRFQIQHFSKNFFRRLFLYFG